MDDRAEIADDRLVELTANIVTAFVSTQLVSIETLPKLIHDVHGALIGVMSCVKVATPVKPIPKVPVAASINDDYLICLENGQKFKSLKRHLMTKYQMTPEQYRNKWELPADYPMVAPAYAKQRSRLAKETGLGSKHDRRRRLKADR
ncbi:MucR family transcriptional regulator [Agrobacterium tumefaciens]|uniref:MucR family transcriptional regulator n=1 Tax=Agrobacterium tumefaciens TaxID=358 RepID=UPI0021D0FFE3|nr:MucR family transcriptional regulator [Agrobacterium tumefaciens]UXS05400.1 transcriptional regulator [Agrobacterium tumefaciens]